MVCNSRDKRWNNSKGEVMQYKALIEITFERYTSTDAMQEAEIQAKIQQCDARVYCVKEADNNWFWED